MKISSGFWLGIGKAVWFTALVVSLGWMIEQYGEQIGLVEKHHRLLAFLLLVLIALVASLVPRVLAHLKQQNHRE